MKLILNCDTVLHVFRHACLADRCNAYGACLALKSCHAPPTFDGRMSVARNVVHVLEQFVPGHDTWSLVSSVRVARAGALFWICTQLFAHINTDICKLVLEHRPDGKVLCLA